MKTAIYIEDGLVQLVLTPESDFEFATLKAFEKDGGLDATVFHGQFYDNRGGWTRQADYKPENEYSYGYNAKGSTERSLIIRAKPMPPPTAVELASEEPTT
jgi:hypothetical protein